MPLITFRFRHSRADDLPWLIELAKRGQFRQQTLGLKQIVYEAGFDLGDPLQLQAALSLATALVHDKKAEAFAGVHSLALPTVREVLRCYQQSCQVEDPHAYCWFETAFRFELTVTTYTLDLDAPKPLLFPCRLAANRVHGIHPEQPFHSSLSDGRVLQFRDWRTDREALLVFHSSLSDGRVLQSRP